MSQLGLPLGWPESREVTFLVGPSNARAVHSIEHRGSWPVRAALLVGPRKSGKTTLGRYFASHGNGTVIDNVERVPEATIFNAWNTAQQSRVPLLMIADAPPPAWRIALPDLRSRIAATPLLSLGDPDEGLMVDLLLHLFDRLMLDARPEVLQWLVPRIERSHIGLIRAVDVLEQATHALRSRRLTIPLARRSLGDAGLLIEPTARRNARP